MFHNCCYQNIVRVNYFNRLNMFLKTLQLQIILKKKKKKMFKSDSLGSKIQFLKNYFYSSSDLSVTKM